MNDSIGREFIQKTRHHLVPDSPQKLGRPQPPLELPFDASAPQIRLPDAKGLPALAVDLRELIEGRRTVRKYADRPLTLEELAGLLWLSQGVKEVTDRPSTLRTVPSAGARHAFETYLLINKVDGVKPGLYRYLAIEHALIELDTSADIHHKVSDASRNQPQVDSGAVTFFWVAVVERMTWRYPERGYRYLFLDAGHICQNEILAAEAIGCGLCPLGAYDDDELNRLFNLDGDDLFVAYAAAVGKKV